MDWVKVTSRRGEVHARAYLTEGVHPKTVWMERFWNPECFDASQANPTGGWRDVYKRQSPLPFTSSG